MTRRDHLLRVAAAARRVVDELEPENDYTDLLLELRAELAALDRVEARAMAVYAVARRSELAS